MSRPRRLDPHDLAPADLFDHLGLEGDDDGEGDDAEQAPA